VPSEPLFYLVVGIAVLVYGVAKGGFGGAMAMLVVPMMALIMSPTRAAAILLPILVLMDILVLRTFWGKFDSRALRLLLPGAMFGIALGYLGADALNESVVRMLVGVIALLFGLQNLLQFAARSQGVHNPLAAAFFGAVSGFTSFSIHAGGPPFAMYLMPRKLAPVVYAGTAAYFFATLNFVKLFPYYFLGQLQFDNLLLALVFMPLAPLGVALGHWLVQRIDATTYYRVISYFLVIVGTKLLWDGLSSSLLS
jgi:uncharacterized membrane protein YfcA